MLSNVKGKEQSTDLKRKSFTTHSVNNSIIQLNASPLVKRIFTLNTEENTRVTASHHFFVIITIT